MWLLLAITLVNHTVTPGAIRPLTLQEICTTKWGLDVRHVDSHLKWLVFNLYGVPEADRHLYIIDHLIPRELGGDDKLENLWPQKRSAAHVKDVQENALHRAVCAPTPTVSLYEAQQRMRNWLSE